VGLPKTTDWCDITAATFVGPYLLKDTINAARKKLTAGKYGNWSK
jgi:hypothetical protein